MYINTVESRLGAGDTFGDDERIFERTASTDVVVFSMGNNMPGGGPVRRVGEEMGMDEQYKDNCQGSWNLFLLSHDMFYTPKALRD